MPRLVTYLNQTPIFERYVVRCGSKKGYQKGMLKRDWTTCSRYDNHSTLKSQHKWGDLHDHVISMRIFTSIMNKIFI